jgi:hypothetical protein
MESVGAEGVGLGLGLEDALLGVDAMGITSSRDLSSEEEEPWGRRRRGACIGCSPAAYVATARMGGRGLADVLFSR